MALASAMAEDAAKPSARCLEERGIPHPTLTRTPRSPPTILRDFKVRLHGRRPGKLKMSWLRAHRYLECGAVLPSLQKYSITS